MTSQNSNFISLYDDHVDSIYRFVYFRVNDKETAWDITQECFLRAFEYFAENEVRNPRALIYQIARNLVIDLWKSRGRQSSVDISELDIQDDSNIEEEMDVKIEVSSLMKAIGELPEASRDLLIFRYVDGLSFSEIAGITGKNQVALRVQASRLLKNIKLKLKNKR